MRFVKIVDVWRAAVQSVLVTLRADTMGPNVEQIRKHATRVVRGRIPASVRRELMAAVKAGVLGRLKKDGLKPEIFFHPDHRNGAIERQTREAAYAIECIATVVVHPLSLAAEASED